MANEGTSLRGMDNNFLFLCVLQVTLANKSIVLYMCSGKVLMDMNFMHIFPFKTLTFKRYPWSLFKKKNNQAHKEVQRYHQSLRKILLHIKKKQ